MEPFHLPLHNLHAIQPEIMERLMNDHHLSWVGLSSGFRLQEETFSSVRQPDFDSWIKLE